MLRALCLSTRFLAAPLLGAFSMHSLREFSESHSKLSALCRHCLGRPWPGEAVLSVQTRMEGCQKAAMAAKKHDGPESPITPFLLM